jgi:RNA exonuclease NGL2
MQEVDRLEKLLPLLDGVGFSHFYAAGPGKKHGCLIAFNKSVFEKVEQRIIQYDEQEVRDGNRGSSIRTANIAALIALKRKQGCGGVAVVTTHLFWHPKYVAHVSRGCHLTTTSGILMRESGQNFGEFTHYLFNGNDPLSDKQEFWFEK